ncbi:hypothetical protein MPSEU_000114900 [Mayamaea pseudoterrestris]|nr:hypothetical protein MPSEU_000114900 [Mayamaea pseudoterrestris]
MKQFATMDAAKSIPPMVSTGMYNTALSVVSPDLQQLDASMSDSSTSSSSLDSVRPVVLADSTKMQLNHGDNSLHHAGGGINMINYSSSSYNTFETCSNMQFDYSFGLNNSISDVTQAAATGDWHGIELFATAVLMSLKSAPVANMKPKTAVIKMKQLPKASNAIKKKQALVKQTLNKSKHKALLLRKPVSAHPAASASERRFPRHAKNSSMTNTAIKQRAKVVSPLPLESSVDATLSTSTVSTCHRDVVTPLPCLSRRHAASNKHDDDDASINSSSSSTTTNKPFATTVTNKDVLSGRGNGIAMLCGNVRFRKLVFAQRAKYSKTLRHEKSQLAQAIIDKVHDYGGRFLEKVGDGDLYRIMDHVRVLEKTSQALRERCTYTSKKR